MHIHEFQSLMKRLYFHRDSRRGVQASYDWLLEEVGELGEALQENNVSAVEEEFADIIAWLASLANLAEIDLEQTVLKKYSFKCPKCGKQRCECTF